MKFAFRYSPRFLASAKGLLSDDDLAELEAFLMFHPLAGDVIKGASGMRKLRFAAKGHGKRGGARVIYIRILDATTISFLECYPKNAKSDLSAAEIETLKKENDL